jgi:hypothetical protein
MFRRLRPGRHRVLSQLQQVDGRVVAQLLHVKCGIPPWRELVKTTASSARRCWRSTPSSSARHLRRDAAGAHQREEWREKVFMHKHMCQARRRPAVRRHRGARLLRAPRRRNPDRIKRHSGARRHQGPVHLMPTLKSHFSPPKETSTMTTFTRPWWHMSQIATAIASLTAGAPRWPTSPSASACR